MLLITQMRNLERVCSRISSIKLQTPASRVLVRGFSSQNEESEGPREVYTGTLAKQIKRVKMFSLTTSVMGLAFQPYLYQQMNAADAHVGSLIALSSTVGFFTFITPFLIHYVAKKYVTEMTYDPRTDEFTAVVYNFFLMRREVKFKAEDVKVPDVPGAFTSFLAKGQPLFCDPQCFYDLSYYTKIMGYDKPIDFEMGNDSSTDSETKEKK